MTGTKKILVELIVITVVGTVISLAANAMNRKGIRLGNDYFPRGRNPIQAVQPVTQPAGTVAAVTNQADDGFDAAAQLIRSDGLQPITHAEVVAMSKDPLYETGGYVFLDDRKDDEYRQGHIPGAYQFYHYEWERFIEEILPICQQAIGIVTYCNGEDCDDSKFAAHTLIERGVDPSRVFVYPGGYTQWRKSNLPVESGERNSGNIVPGHNGGGAHE